MKKKNERLSGILNNCTFSFLRDLNLENVSMNLNFIKVKGKETVTKMQLYCKIEEYATVIKALDLNYVGYVREYEKNYDKFKITLSDYPVEFIIFMQSFINE